MKPTLCACIIARNEARDIGRCVRSLSGVVDQIVLVDTGSTDLTIAVFCEAALEIGLTPRAFSYFEASERLESGEYRLINFSQARNRALDLARETGCSHIFWIDADDAVETPLAIRRIPYLPRACYGVWVELDQSGQRQVHHRVFPADA